MTDHRAQVKPLLRGAAPEVHQAVLRLRHARDRQPAGVSPRPAQHLEIGDRVVRQAEDLRLEHRQVDDLSRPPSVFAARPRGHGRGARVGSGEVLTDLSADENRRALR